MSIMRIAMIRRVLMMLAVVAILVRTSLLCPAALPPLSSARIGHYHRALELHFGFEGTAPRWTLTTHGKELWIDLPKTPTALPPRPLFGQETPPIKTIRIAEASPGGTRIVIEVEGKTDYAIARTRNEIVLRVATAGTVANIGAPLVVSNDERPLSTRELGRNPPENQPSAIPPVPKQSSAETPSAPMARAQSPPPPAPSQVAMATEGTAQTPRSHVVMIDPGHGGYDPGTSSALGLQEKDLALAISMKLQQALEARGIQTQMTRTSDVFIPLAERTNLANRADADLFVSIHLNSSPNSATTGIEVYYLNNTTDRATIRLAKMENAGAPGDYGAGGSANLNYILTDLRQQYKATEAASLARMIDSQAAADLTTGMGMNVNALGAKMGPFYVLVGAHMPAVLVETGFLSNAEEAQHLASTRYQEVLADGVATAVANYFNTDMAVGNL